MCCLDHVYTHRYIHIYTYIYICHFNGKQGHECSQYLTIYTPSLCLFVKGGMLCFGSTIWYLCVGVTSSVSADNVIRQNWSRTSIIMIYQLLLASLCGLKPQWAASLVSEPSCCYEVCFNPNHNILTLTEWFTVTKLYQHVDEKKKSKKEKKLQRDTNQSVLSNKAKMYARPSLGSVQILGLAVCCIRVGLNTQTALGSCE